MLMYDYKCSSCKNVFEEMVKSDDRDLKQECPECGHNAKRIITPIRCRLEGTSGDFPGAYDRWARTHEQQTKIEEKAIKEHGSTNISHL